MTINTVEVQSPLISGVNFKTLNSNNLLGGGNYNAPTLNRIKLCNIIPSTGAQVVATTANTITYSALIPANTFTTNGILNFNCRLGRLGGTTSNWNVRIYTNTTNSLTGAVQVGSIQNATGSILFIQSIRYFRLESGNIYAYTTSFQNTTDILNQGNLEVSTSFALNVDNYILVAIQKNVLNTETCQGLFLKLIGYE